MKQLIAFFLAALLLFPVTLVFSEDTTSGASQVIDEEKQLTQEQIRDLALQYLRGFPLTEDENGAEVWAFREMYQIATVHGNMPGLSSVEFVIDTTNMRLYAASEKGTEKVVDIAQNPNVVLYWYRQIPEAEYIPQKNDYFNSYGVQIRGTARLMSPADEHFGRVAALYLRTLYGAALWDGMDEQTKEARIQRLAEINEWIEVLPDEYAVTSLLWIYNKENSTRPQYYDPNSPYFGKSPRQVYIVK